MIVWFALLNWSLLSTKITAANHTADRRLCFTGSRILRHIDQYCLYCTHIQLWILHPSNWIYRHTANYWFKCRLIHPWNWILYSTSCVLYDPFFKSSCSNNCMHTTIVFTAITYTNSLKTSPWVFSVTRDPLFQRHPKSMPFSPREMIQFWVKNLDIWANQLIISDSTWGGPSRPQFQGKRRSNIWWNQ